jgi:VIT1/CCC1 family predicted Fe2+/Mn2+ transporter
VVVGSPAAPSPSATGPAGPTEPHAKHRDLGDFILGWQDGLVNVLGIVLGLAAAGSGVHILLVGGFAATFAEAVSMGAVAYTSTMARRDQYLAEKERERREMREVPEIERREVRDVFLSWGYPRDEADDLTERIAKNHHAWLEFMMAHELKLQPIEESEVRRSALLVFVSTVIGSLIPLVPVIVFYNAREGAIGALVVSAVALFIIGYYGAKYTVGSPRRNGVQLLLIGILAGLAGFGIGLLLGAGGV